MHIGIGHLALGQACLFARKHPVLPTVLILGSAPTDELRDALRDFDREGALAIVEKKIDSTPRSRQPGFSSP
jgi:hypothetical protein